MDVVVQFRGTVYENGYGQIAQKVMRDPKLHRNAKVIYAYLCSFAGGNVLDPKWSWPSVSLMMKELGFKKEETFYRYRKELIDSGYINVEQYRDGKGLFTRNLYIIELQPQPK